MTTFSPPVLLAGLLYYSFLGGWVDTFLLLGFSLWRKRELVLASLDVDYDALKSAALALPGIFAGILLFQVARVALSTLDSPRWTGGPGRPLLIPCRTTHRRLFPEKHAFSYSYLTVGIPVGWTGTAGGMVSTGVSTESGILSWLSLRPTLRRGWFDVDPADYLERGSAHLGLRGKLDSYLKSQVRRCFS
jgi:hypothetical protein